jgi:Domain of unknown function (DUF6542)
MQPTGPRTVMAQSGGRRDGAARGAGGPRSARRRSNPTRARGVARWGAWQGGLGVCVIVSSAAIGAIGTMLTRSAPGFLLGLLVVAGSAAAALAVRPRAGRMILPVPALSYLVAALISGVVFNRSAGMSKAELAIDAAQWIADGFFAMALATLLAAAITTARWYLWRRGQGGQPAGREQGWPDPEPPASLAARPAPPAARPARTGPAGPGPAGSGPAGSGPTGTGPTRTGRPQASWDATAGSGYRAAPGSARESGAADATDVWDDRGPRGTGPRPGSGPYNLSSGA